MQTGKGLKPFDPLTGREVMRAPFEESRKASRLGVKWSELLGAWWVACDLGYLNPPAPLVYLMMPYDECEVPGAAGARWVNSEKA